MKQIIFTTLILLTFMAVSQNAFCQSIILGNCPYFDDYEKCLQTYDGKGHASITITYKQKAQAFFTNNNWYVEFITEDATIFLNKYKFIHAFDSYSYEYNSPDYFIFPMEPNANNWNSFTINLRRSDGNIITSYDSPIFDICENISPQPEGPQYDKTVNPANENEAVIFQIFDTVGKSIYTTELKHEDAGFYTKHFEDLPLTKGVYFCKIQYSNFQKSLRVVKL